MCDCLWLQVSVLHTFKFEVRFAPSDFPLIRLRHYLQRYLECLFVSRLGRFYAPDGREDTEIDTGSLDS